MSQRKAKQRKQRKPHPGSSSLARVKAPRSPADEGGRAQGALAPVVPLPGLPGPSAGPSRLEREDLLELKFHHAEMGRLRARVDLARGELERAQAASDAQGREYTAFVLRAREKYALTDADKWNLDNGDILREPRS